jgi:hypothetical protein
MASATIDYMDLLKDIPAGAWVAISEREGRVIAFAADLPTAMKLAHESGEDEPLIVRVPEQNTVLFL